MRRLHPTSSSRASCRKSGRPNGTMSSTYAAPGPQDGIASSSATDRAWSTTAAKNSMRLSVESTAWDRTGSTYTGCGIPGRGGGSTPARLSQRLFIFLKPVASCIRPDRAPPIAPGNRRSRREAIPEAGLSAYQYSELLWTDFIDAKREVISRRAFGLRLPRHGPQIGLCDRAAMHLWEKVGGLTLREPDRPPVISRR